MPSNQPLEFRWKHDGRPIQARTLRITGVLLLALSVVLLVIAGVSAGKTLNLRNHAVRATGRVDALIEVHSSQGGTSTPSITYKPQFSFTAEDGTRHSVTSDFSSSPAPFAVGDPVPVLYAPGDPESARIDSFWQMWFAPVLLGGFGFGWAVAGSVVLVFARLKARREIG